MRPNIPEVERSTRSSPHTRWTKRLLVGQPNNDVGVLVMTAINGRSISDRSTSAGGQ